MKTADTNEPCVLVADDQADVLEALRLLLKGEGYRIETVTSPAAVLEHLGKRDCDLLLIDLNYTRDTTSGHEGLDLLTRLQQLDATLPVVVMTAWGSVEVAVAGVGRGAGRLLHQPLGHSGVVGGVRTHNWFGRA